LVRNPDRAPAGTEQPLVVATIALECLPGAIGPVAVGLDDHALLTPYEVGPDSRIAIW
jgi:hypothetical protein